MQLHQLDPGLIILPAHDRLAWESVFGTTPVGAPPRVDRQVLARGVFAVDGDDPTPRLVGLEGLTQHRDRAHRVFVFFGELAPATRGHPDVERAFARV